MVAPSQELPEEPFQDPTPEQIRERSAQIRKNWTPRVRQRRKVQNESKTWLPPFIQVADIAANAAQPKNN